MSEIRDPIYGFIVPTEVEFKIINTPIFQRLRKIKQLALANLVYPSANHTRFDHSLGVLYVANMMAEKLLSKEENKEENDEKRKIIRLAALLHDIGHGPFSHVSEYPLNKYSSIVPGEETEKIHEKITTHLISTNKALKEILIDDERQQIIGLLTSKSVKPTLMRQIVSGPLDADKQDYLLRDSYFCGVKYGIYDPNRLINTLYKYRDNGDEHLCIKHDGVNTLEQFVLAKYYMLKQVYYHKIRIVTDAMINRGIELGIEKDNIDFLSRLYRYEEKGEYFDHFLSWWDDKFFVEMLSDKYKGTYAQNIFKNLFERNLFKKIFYIDLKQSQPDIKPLIKNKIYDINTTENENLKKVIEKRVAEIVKVDAEYVIANSTKIKSVREMSRDSEGEITVEKEDGNKSTFLNESTVFQSIDESLRDVSFEIYSPVEYKDKKDKEEKKEIYKKEIQNILKGIKED